MRIVIIGAGALGASAAFHLTRAAAQVTIIDAQLDGRATAAGAGIICPWTSGVDDPDFYRLYTASGEYYPELVAALAQAGETDLGYRRAGALLVSDDAQELTWIERILRQRATAPMGEIALLSANQAQDLFPPLRQGLGGIRIGGGARVDGRRLAGALLRAAASHGATVLQGHATPVIETGRVIGVALGHDRLPADRVIVTAGAWSDDLLRPLGVNLAIEPQRGQIIHLQLPDVETQDWPVILPTGSHYIVAFDAGRIVAGATREAGSGFDYRVTASGQQQVLSEALRIAPGLGTATLLETRVGFRPVAPDVRPRLGWARGIDGLAIGNGLGAAGLTIGPLAGRLLADLVTERPGLIDLAPFDPSQPKGSASLRSETLR